MAEGGLLGDGFLCEGLGLDGGFCLVGKGRGELRVVVDVVDGATTGEETFLDAEPTGALTDAATEDETEDEGEKDGSDEEDELERGDARCRLGGSGSGVGSC